MDNPTLPPVNPSTSPQAESIELIAQELDEIRDLATNGNQSLILAQQKHRAESLEQGKETQRMLVNLIRSVEQLSEENKNTSTRLTAIERRQNVNGAAE